MPNDFESHALQKLLGLNQEMVAPMVPDFLNAMNMMPGISGADDQLQALAGMVPPDIYGSLAALLAPPPIEAAGTTLPKSANTGVVNVQQALPRQTQQRPQQRQGGSMSAAVDQRARERQAAANKAAKERVHKENLARQAKKGKK